MNIKIVAKSDRGVFAGIDAEQEYAVISIDDVVDIELGDVLSTPTWTDRDGLFKRVQNVTQRREVGICIENWSCTRALAYDFLLRLNSPTEIKSIEG